MADFYWFRFNFSQVDFEVTHLHLYYNSNHVGHDDVCIVSVLCCVFLWRWEVDRISFSQNLHVGSCFEIRVTLVADMKNCIENLWLNLMSWMQQEEFLDYCVKWWFFGDENEIDLCWTSFIIVGGWKKLRGEVCGGEEKDFVQMRDEDFEM